MNRQRGSLLQQLRITRLDRYLAAELFRGYLVVALVLVALFSIMTFIDELGDVGDGVYDVGQALTFVGMTLPSRVLRLLPFITLFGSALAIWQLARRSELVVLRAAGMSLRRLAYSTALPGVVLVVTVPLLYEFVAPTLYQGATLSREAALAQGEDAPGQGFWSRRGNTVVEVSGLEYGRVPSDIRIYQLGDDARLEALVEADSADPQDDGTWLLRDVRERRYAADQIDWERSAARIWRPWWADSTPLNPPPVDSLSFSDLRGYIQYLEETGQPVQRWQLAYWRMWLLPVTALLMALLAVPIARLGPREGEARLFILVTAGGLLYFFGEQIVANAVLVSWSSPLLAAAVPPMALALAVGWVLRRLSG